MVYATFKQMSQLVLKTGQNEQVSVLSTTKLAHLFECCVFKKLASACTKHLTVPEHLNNGVDIISLFWHCMFFSRHSSKALKVNIDSCARGESATLKSRLFTHDWRLTV